MENKHQIILHSDRYNGETKDVCKKRNLWHMRLVKKAKQYAISKMPVIAQEILFVGERCDKYIGDLPNIVQDDSEQIFEKWIINLEKTEQAKNVKKALEKRKNLDFRGHFFHSKDASKHQQYVLAGAQKDLYIKISIMESAYIDSKYKLFWLQSVTHKETAFMHVFEQWAKHEKEARKSRRVRWSEQAEQKRAVL
jgi:hypothetical protein